ncbi:calponin homology domain-containing protein DDB_G0272472-like [Diabrotica virgifera virgifera]|uniref:Calponin homology domain-containing protein DDB_G0272472-like n=1 Tax=Diabrotica virgifera virgifera TaxID=50390 RepID=A0A6P7FRY4_DIAVI|nr:calponin homology domain-containing protein DDB_G0272472-like [Diabrotica virgifera virgifera]
MPINVKISLCKITRASKLFQRNYYLPLLKPLSPKDALRRKIITGQNVLGNRIEHYIPVLKPHDEKIAEKRRRGKGVPVVKKRIKRHATERYVIPFLDENMENHGILQNILRRKSKGKGQHYLYEVTDKMCTLVIDSQMEKALKDKDIVDIVMAQRSEKVVFKLSNELKITLPLAPFNDNVPLYRGSGWTKEYVEQEHHHGKETMSIAKLFEAKESGVEDWELEMMRLANKRKKKHKGEDNADWKQMLSGCLEEMDWDKFEEDTKQIVEEQEEVVEEENIPMEVNDMDKTTNVAAKLKAAGEEVICQLPVMKEIPEVIKNLETGEMCELANVSGAMITLPSNSKECFVVGQMVKSDENEVFVPGQTLISEDGNADYTPGITINDDLEPTLIAGLVMGEEESTPMFLPGESTITEEGQLKFESTEEDRPRRRRLPSDSPPPPPKPKPRPKVEEEIVIRRRVTDEPTEPLIKERVKKRAPVIELKRPDSPPREIRKVREPMEDPLKLMEEQRRKREEEERKRMKDRLEEKILKEESKVDKLRLDMRKKFLNLKFEKPKEYVPIEPIKKSQKLEELELSIKKGTFFDDTKTKDILEKAKSATRMLKYQHVLNAYGNDFGKRF